MKKFILLIFVIYFPLNAFAVSNTDIYTQQNISGTFLESGYADIKLKKNAKNTVMDILYHQIIDYIFDNLDPETAKTISIYMPANIQECDDEYLSNIEQEISLNYSSDVLYICREDVYTKNLEYILKETANASKGSYYILLENMFQDHTKEILNMKEFTMDNFINILAVNNLLSFSGRLYFDRTSADTVDNVKCENSHLYIPLINPADKRVMDNITINGRDFFIHGCLVKNKHNYFKYIKMYEKNNDEYTLYSRLPLYNHTYSKNNSNEYSNALYADINKLHLNIYDPMNDNTSLVFDYMVYRKGTYLQSFYINHNKNIEYIYVDTSPDKFTYTEKNLSMILFKKMFDNYCSKGSEVCRALQSEQLIPFAQ